MWCDMCELWCLYGIYVLWSPFHSCVLWSPSDRLCFTKFVLYNLVTFLNCRHCILLVYYEVRLIFVSNVVVGGILALYLWYLNYKGIFYLCVVKSVGLSRTELWNLFDMETVCFFCCKFRLVRCEKYLTFVCYELHVPLSCPFVKGI